MRAPVLLGRILFWATLPVLGLAWIGALIYARIVEDPSSSERDHK